MGKKKQPAQNLDFAPLERRALIAYYLTLTAFFVSSFFPQARVWGINWWAFYPLWVKFALLIIGALIPLVVWRWSAKWDDPERDISDRTYWLVSVGILVGFGLLFYLLRARTHFLGDGYQLLGTLSSENFYVKFRNRGSMGLQFWLTNLLGGRSEANALLSYQITSIGAGILFVNALIISARKLIHENVERLLFVLSVSSGGYMLLFFGYVENYALFVVSVLAYCLIGLLVAQSKITRWWILLPQTLAVFFHVFGVVFLPATIYLLAAESPLAIWMSSLKRTAKLSLAALVVAIAAAVFYYTYTTSYFFRFSLVPLVADRFTVEGYTLFSINHLLDFANLAVMLMPGLAVLLLARPLKWRDILTDRAARFLLLASVCALGAAFVFDPKLGMPRDWDLFAFCGVPVFAGMLWFTKSALSSTSYQKRLLLLNLALCVIVLLTRETTQVSSSRSISVTMDYIELDKTKSAPSRFLLKQYFEQKGDSITIDILKEQWASDLRPDEVLLSAVELVDNGKAREALPLLESVSRIRPNNFIIWAYWGRCFYSMGQYDSALAYLVIADGMNPYNKNVAFNLGVTCYQKHDYDKATDYLTQAIEIDSLYYDAYLALLMTYQDSEMTMAYLDLLYIITNRPKPPVDFIRELVWHYVQNGQFDSAEVTIRRGLTKGLDSASVRELVREYPQLDTLM